MKKFITLLSIVSFSIISCSNFINPAVESYPASAESYCTIRGSFVSEDFSGAVLRSAFPANNVDLRLYTTNIYYKSSPAETQKTLCGTTQDNDFELKLSSFGTYYLEAESYLTSDETKTVVLKTTSPVELTLTEEVPYKNDVRMFLRATANTSETGFIDLYMKSFDASKVVKMEIYKDNSNDTISNLIFEAADSLVNWNADNVAAGAHTYTFKFYSDSSSTELVYQCTETITVLPGKTTDTWVNNGNAEYFSTETIDGKETVVMNITQDCLDNFALTNFYVDSDGGDDSGNGSFFEPVKTLGKAVDKCTDSSKNYTINIMKDVNVDSGITVSNNITIQNAPGKSAKIKYTSDTGRLFTVSAEKTFKISYIDIEGPDSESNSIEGAAINNSGNLVLDNVNFSKFKNGKGSGQGGCLHNTGNGTISVTGGSITSCQSGQGGAIYNAGGEIDIKDCTINSCTAGQAGGAIYNNSTAKITLSGNTVIGEKDKSTAPTASNFGNKADGGGGGIFLENGELYLTDNTVIGYNYSGLTGGGIHLNSGKKVYLQDNACIKNCAAASGGNGIYTSAASCRVYMKDSAYLDSASDIRLNANGYVSLNGNLTPPAAANGIAATLTPQFYNVDDENFPCDPYILLQEDSAGLIAGNYIKFAVTSKDEDPAIEWYVTAKGKLNSKLPEEVLLASLSAAPTETTKVYIVDSSEELAPLVAWVNAGNTLENIKFKLNSDITLDNEWTSIGTFTSI